MATFSKTRRRTARRHRPLKTTPLRRMEFLLSSSASGLKWDFPPSPLFPSLGLHFRHGQWRPNRFPPSLPTQTESEKTIRPLGWWRTLFPSTPTAPLRWQDSFLRLRRQFTANILPTPPPLGSLITFLPNHLLRVGRRKRKKKRGGGYILATPCQKYFIPSSRTTPFPPIPLNRLSRSSYGRWLSFSRLFSYAAYSLLRRLPLLPSSVFFHPVHFRQKALLRSLLRSRPNPLLPLFPPKPLSRLFRFRSIGFVPARFPIRFPPKPKRFGPRHKKRKFVYRAPTR